LEKAIYGENTDGTYGYLGGSLYSVYGRNSSGTYGFLGNPSYGAYGEHDPSENYGYLGNSLYGAYGKHEQSGNYGYLGGSSHGVYGISNSGHAGYFEGKSYFGGDVGIGTEDPSAKLEVQGGPIKATGGLIIETRTSDPSNPVTGQIWLIVD
jgi:hypothetical protein